MKRLAFLFMCIVGFATVVRGDAVTVTNLSGQTLDVFLKEADATDYRTVSAGLFDSRRQRLNVTQFPFRIAVSKSPKRYSFLGPFNRDPSVAVPDIRITQKDVFETRVGERWFFDCCTGQWVRRTMTFIVSHKVDHIELRGLIPVGPYAASPLDHEAPAEPANVPSQP